MAVKTQDGARYVSVPVEVPGDQETVWNAIATGPGVTAWMAPTRIDGRVGGRVEVEFGPGMVSVAEITAWNPPHGFSASSNDPGPDAPPLLTDWTVKPLGDDRCRVTVRHTIHAADDRYDVHLTSTEAGWPGFFRVLDAYLTHFPGQESATIGVMRQTELPPTQAWNRIVSSLESDAGDHDRPPWSGRVLHTHTQGYHEQVVRLDEPAPGVAIRSAWEAGGKTYVMLTAHLFGDDAPAIAERDQPRWDAWIDSVLAV